MIAALLAAALAGPGVDLGDCPEPFETTALERFEAMLVDGRAADEVGFADCLAQLGLLHSAQRHYLEVVGGAVGSEPWHQAVDRSMVLVDELGDPHSVLPYLRDVDPRRVQAVQGRDALYFVNGQALLLEGKYELAAVRLEEVEPASRWGAASALFQARALELAERPTAALELYKEVPEGSSREEALTRRAMLLARLGRTGPALDAIAQLEGSRPEAMVAALRTQLLREAGQHDEAVESARVAVRLAREAYLPEADLVAGEVAADVCRTRSAQRHLDRFHAEWDGVALALDTAVNVGKVDGNRLYDQWLTSGSPGWGLPPKVLATAIEAQPEREYLEGHLARLDPERQRTQAIADPGFQAVVAPHLLAVLDDGERQLKYLLGHAVASRIRDMHDELVIHERASERLAARIAQCDDQP